MIMLLFRGFFGGGGGVLFFFVLFCVFRRPCVQDLYVLLSFIRRPCYIVPGVVSLLELYALSGLCCHVRTLVFISGHSQGSVFVRSDLECVLVRLH